MGGGGGGALRGHGLCRALMLWINCIASDNTEEFNCGDWLKRTN